MERGEIITDAKGRRHRITDISRYRFGKSLEGLEVDMVEVVR